MVAGDSMTGLLSLHTRSLLKLEQNGLPRSSGDALHERCSMRYNSRRFHAAIGDTAAAMLPPSVNVGHSHLA